MKVLNRTLRWITLILIATVAFSEPIDSLLMRLPTVSGKDKVKLLTDICTGYREIAPRKGLDYGRLGWNLAREIGDESGESEILDAMAFNFIVLGMYDSTIYFSTLSQRIDEKIGNKKGLSQSINNFGVAYYFSGNYVQALSNHIRALHLREELLDSVGLSNCKSIRDDSGYWHQVEEYFKEHSGTIFTCGICPDCAKKLYPDYYDKMFAKESKTEQAK